VSWIVISRFNSRDEFKNLVSVRLLAMLLAVVLILYCDSYALSADAVHDEAHAGAFRLLLPNLTFILAALVLAVFRFNPAPTTEPEALAMTATIGADNANSRRPGICTASIPMMHSGD